MYFCWDILNFACNVNTVKVVVQVREVDKVRAGAFAFAFAFGQHL